LKRLDSRLRGNDRKERFWTFYEAVKFAMTKTEGANDPILFLEFWHLKLFRASDFVIRI